MRKMSLTEAMVRRVERIEPDPGPDPGLRDYDDAEFFAMAEALAVARPPGPLWVFAYGSLIWNPVFAHDAVCAAVVHGWHRSFCFQVTRWRGTRETPSLMMALDRGGSCRGLAYRLTGDTPQAHFKALLERELDGCPPTNVPRWIKVSTAQGHLLALTFVANPKGPTYRGRVAPEQVANGLARAAGSLGSAASYLFRTVTGLEQSGIRDRTLWRLQALVAVELDSDPGPALAGSAGTD